MRTSDQLTRQSVKQVAEGLAFAENLGRTVAYKRLLQEGLVVSDALRRALRLAAHEALTLAEQYRRHANGVISDMIVASTEISEADFANIVKLAIRRATRISEISFRVTTPTRRPCFGPS